MDKIRTATSTDQPAENIRRPCPLPDAPGTGAARDGRGQRKAGGGSVPLPTGSVCLLGPVRCVRRTLAAAASGVGLRGLVHRRPCVAGGVPMLGRAAGETRLSFGNNRWA